MAKPVGNKFRVVREAASPGAGRQARCQLARGVVSVKLCLSRLAFRSGSNRLVQADDEGVPMAS